MRGRSNYILHMVGYFVHFSKSSLRTTRILTSPLPANEIFNMKVSLLFGFTILLNSPAFWFSSAATLLPSPSLDLGAGLEETAAPVPEEPTIEPNCRSCGRECQTYDIERDGGRCKCDADCEAYSDCCGPSSTQRAAACEGTSPDSRLNELQFTCQSIYLDSEIDVMASESFWMVSRCSPDWLAEVGESGQTVLESCVSKSRDLPPVTDPVSGIVYRNQHCALCNRVEDTVPWEASIVCTEYLYDLLETVPFSELNPSLFREQCQPCSYQYPRTLPHVPRACYPNVISTCLDKARLPKLSQEVYEVLANECVNGSYDLQAAILLQPFSFDARSTVSPPLYRNRACAECNQVFDQRCLRETSRAANMVPIQCIPNIPLPTSEPPPTTPPPPTVTPDFNRTFPIGERPLVIGPPIDGIEAERPEALRPEPPPTQGGIPFTITLSNFGGGHVTVRTDTQTVNVTVSCPEGQAAVGLDCRDTLCPENFVSLDGKCFSQQLNDGNQSTNNSDSGSGFFLDCPTQLVVLNDTEFTQLTNETVLVDGEVIAILSYSADGQPLICPNNVTTVQVNTTIFSYPVGYLELTYVGCSLSVIGSALVLITYSLFKELRSLPSKILMNLAFANLVTNLLILVGGPVSQVYPIVELCTSVAIILHFFFLAQFAWMSIMSLEVVRKFHRAKKLIVDSKCEKLQLLIAYMLTGWGLPLLITTVSIVVNFTTQGLVLYGILADGSLGSCWINHLESALIAFVVPLVLSISFNLVMFIIVSVYIFMASRSQAKLNREDATPFLHLNIAIFCTTGLTWVFGFVAILAGTSWAWYLFIIFNSTQGFVIFVAFLFTKKTLKLYLNFLTCKRATDKTSKSVSISGRASSSIPVQSTIVLRTEKPGENGRGFPDAAVVPATENPL